MLEGMQDEMMMTWCVVLLKRHSSIVRLPGRYVVYYPRERRPREHGTVLQVIDLPTNEQMKAQFPGFNEEWHRVDISNMEQASYVTERDFDVVFWTAENSQRMLNTSSSSPLARSSSATTYGG